MLPGLFASGEIEKLKRVRLLPGISKF